MSRSLVASATVAVSLFLAAGSARAQNPGNPSILNAVQQLQTSVDALQSSVNKVEVNVEGIDSIKSALTTLQNTLNALTSATQSNVRFTPLVDVAPPDLAGCDVVNVSTQTRIVRAEIFNLNGQLAEPALTTTLQPGSGTGFGNRTANFFYCKFTVVDGTKADIRGSMSICTNTACKQTVPAE